MIDCTKCSEKGCCCGIFPMDKALIDKHKDKFQVKPEKIVDMVNRAGILTKDLFCVFLDRRTKLCAIYEDRPQVCKDYGVTKEPRLQCLYFKPSGAIRSEASKRKVQRLIDKMFNDLTKN